MNCCPVFRRFTQLTTLASLLLVCTPALAQMWISEVYLDAPSSLDSTREYIEIRGIPGASLTDHYLIVLENEISATANPGAVEAVFDLGALSTPTLGTNGFLTLRQAGNPYVDLNPLATNLANDAVGATWGSGTLSSVGFSDENADGILENSGGTFMLIRNNGGVATAPAITAPDLIDLDADNNNELDDNLFLQNWTILDAIGVNGESSDVNGYLYASINFSPGVPAEGPNVPAGATFVETWFEIEYFARWGNSTGATAADWHMSNLTNDPDAGYDGPADFRQSGEPHGITTASQYVESSQGVPYGTKLTSTMGGENLFIVDGDFDADYDGEQYVFDGDVDGRDLLVWQRNFGYGANLSGTPRYATRRHGDANGDRIVDAADLALWQINYGTSSLALSPASLSVPEPAAWLLLVLGCLGSRWRTRG